MIKYSIILHYIFHLGAHVIEATVSLNSHQLLRPNYSIGVVSVHVCSAAADLTVENGGCNNKYEAANIQLLVSQQAHIIIHTCTSYKQCFANTGRHWSGLTTFQMN